MSVEVEAKLKVESLDPVRARLTEGGASFVRAAIESNRVYDTSDGRLRGAGSVLRVRGLCVTGGALAAATMTYKGPRLSGKVKRRQEIEMEIVDAAAAGRLLEALGYVLICTIEKRRESWDFLGCEVALDEVPHLGTFVEIEGPDETTIARAQSALGLEHLEHIKLGYVALLFDYCHRHDLPTTHIGFERG